MVCCVEWSCWFTVAMLSSDWSITFFKHDSSTSSLLHSSTILLLLFIGRIDSGQKRCSHCGMKVQKKCNKCGVVLHSCCFELFHTRWVIRLWTLFLSPSTCTSCEQWCRSGVSWNDALNFCCVYNFCLICNCVLCFVVHLCSYSMKYSWHIIIM